MDRLERLSIPVQGRCHFEEVETDDFSPEKTFLFYGRSDGIGNRIEQLIYLQEYCFEHGLFCIYVWNNTSLRNYLPLITFSRIKIVQHIDPSMKDLPIKNGSVSFKRTKGFIVKYDFLFKPYTIVPEYDTIIHIRATDRLTNGIGDFSTEHELKNVFIRNTINYLNNNSDIQTYTIVCDDESYKENMKSQIKKTYVDLPYVPTSCIIGDISQPVPKEWLDYYYITQAKKRIIMCCKFSSYSITASILANKKLLVFPPSFFTNLPRYKADIEPILIFLI